MAANYQVLLIKVGPGECAKFLTPPKYPIIPISSSISQKIFTTLFMHGAFPPDKTAELVLSGWQMIQDDESCNLLTSLIREREGCVD